MKVMHQNHQLMLLPNKLLLKHQLQLLPNLRLMPLPQLRLLLRQAHQRKIRMLIQKPLKVTKK